MLLDMRHKNAKFEKALDQLVPGFSMADLLAKIGKLPTQRKAEIKTGQAVLRKADDRTIAQLQEQRFSGIRANELWNRFEIWIYGRIDRTVTYQEIFLNPQRLNTAYCEAFGIDHINLDAATQRELRKLEERKSQLSEPEVQDAASRLVDPTLQEKADLKTYEKDEAKRPKG